MPRAQAIFVAQAGRKFRLFSLAMQRYKKFRYNPMFFVKVSEKLVLCLSFVVLAD